MSNSTPQRMAAEALLNLTKTVAGLRVPHFIHGKRREALVDQSALMLAVKHVVDASPCTQPMDALAMMIVARGRVNGAGYDAIIESAADALRAAVAASIENERKQAEAAAAVDKSGQGN